MIDNFGTPFDSEAPLSFQIVMPECFMRTQNELKPELFKKLSDKTLIYIFYNMDKKDYQMEAVRILYSREWVYDYQECLWFQKLDMNTLADPNFFHIKKWEMVPYQFQLRKEQFAKLEDFEQCLKIKENISSPSP